MRGDKKSLNYKVFKITSRRIDVIPLYPSYVKDNYVKDIFNWEWLDILFVVHMAVNDSINTIYHNIFGRRLPIGCYIRLRG